MLATLSGCGSSKDAPALGELADSPTRWSVPKFRHVFVLVLENEGAERVFGPTNADAPYLNSLAREWTYLDKYSGVDHNSLPNYIALTSGQASTAKTRSDCRRYNCIYPDAVHNIGDLVEATNRTWKAYTDGTDDACKHSREGFVDAFSLYVKGFSTYAQRHVPFLYYANVVRNESRCNSHVVPYSTLTDDLTSGHLPDFGFITPDLCHDGHAHSCGIKAADLWTSQQIPRLLQNDDFRNGGVLFVTFDEAPGDNSGCCGNAHGGHIGAIVVSPTWGLPPGSHGSTPANHYSLLRTVEDAWGLPLLGHSADPGISPMTDLFESRPR